MAKLPKITRIRREDLPDAPAWISKLLYPLNLFMDGVISAFKGNLTFVDNIRSQIKEISFETSSAYDGTDANFDTVSFLRDMATKPQGLILLQIVKDSDTHAPIEGGVYVDWLDVNGVIEIYLVRGLAVSSKYTMKVLLI